VQNVWDFVDAILLYTRIEIYNIFWLFIHLFYFIIQQHSCEHFNLPILFRSNFNNFVILAKHKVNSLKMMQLHSDM